MTTAIKCQNCGANLAVADDALRVTCSYCNAVNELGSQAAQPRAPTAVQPRPLPTSSSKSPPLAVGCGLLVACAGGAFALYAVIEQMSYVQWAGTTGPLLVDTDGNGTTEVVGLIRFMEGTEDITVTGAVAAYDADSLDQIWATRFEGTESSSLILAAAGGRLWVADGLGHLRALDPKTGAITADISTGEPVERFCGDGSGGLEVWRKDRTRHRVDLQTGALSLVGDLDWQTPCLGGIWGSVPGQTPSTAWDDHTSDIAIPDVSVSGRLVTPDGDLLAAERSRGTRTGLVIARDSAGNVRWTAVVPGGQPLLAEEGAPDAVGWGKGRAYASWSVKEGETPQRIAAFDAGTGQRLWDAELQDDAGDPEAIVTDGERVYVSHWTWLEVFRADNGEKIGSIGRW